MKNTNPGDILTDLEPNRDTVRVMPLGGLGEIGMNCTLFEYDGACIMVDCGQMMPEEEMLGIDYVIPDLTYLEGRPGALRAIVLTHAHEDHVGALPYVLPKFPGIPIYTTRLTAAILKEKLREHSIQPQFIELRPRQPVEVAPGFVVEGINVTHSIIDAVALAIRTPAGVIVHSGDFKMDPNPPDGVAFDHYAFARYAEEEQDGILLLMSDSTNSDRRGSCPSETEVIPGLEALFRQSPNTLVISTFSSSLHRIQTVFNLAAKYGRTVISCGLNMERNIRIASALGALDIPCQYSDNPRAASQVPRHKRLILCTGSQGEPMSSLARMSMGNHRDIEIEEGDTVVLSARRIPGNEDAIYRMVNHLSRRGARVIHEGMALIHVSGHAYRDDMKHLINLTNPRYFTPIHGEFRHLREHSDLAREQGLEEGEIFLLENGDCLELTSDGGEIIGKVPHGRVLVDGKGVGDVDEVVLRDRKYLAEDGMLVVILGTDHETGEVLSGPEIVMRGFVLGESSEEGSMTQRFKDLVMEAYNELTPEERTEQSTLQAAIKRTLRRFIRRQSSRFPVILPVVLEL
ncbi:ribonuclease J [Candidatus Poribacteria bacterium]|nr:ribonuclease J [Candidatus Poribacteria bacterium]